MRGVTLILIIVAMATHSCSHKRDGRLLNESLRLSDSEIQFYKQRASSGDAAAAKKLWHHYDFVVLNIEEGEKWRKVYENLSQANDTQQTSPSHP